MKKLSVLFTTFAVAATLSLAGCANVVSSTPDLPVTHTVVFDSNGGTAVASQTVEDGSLAIEPSTTNGSHNLVGWYNGSAKYDFTSKVTSDLSLTAKWTTTNVTKVQYDSSVSYNVLNVPKTYKGWVILNLKDNTFENWGLVNSVQTLLASGTFVKTTTSIAFTFTTSTINSAYVGQTTSYEVSGDSWTWSANPYLYGFGNTHSTNTTVTTKVLTSEEVE